MKVNISYAVDLEDVPSEVGKLISSVQYQVAHMLDNIDNLATSNPLQAIREIAEIRESLSSLDLRLGDCSSILSGYLELQSKIDSGNTEHDEKGKDLESI